MSGQPEAERHRSPLIDQCLRQQDVDQKSGKGSTNATQDTDDSPTQLARTKESPVRRQLLAGGFKVVSEGLDR